jgi:hypothetical protein
MMTNTRDELIAIEHAAWDALSSSGADASAFYDRVLAREVLMLLPGGMVIDDRAQVVQSMHAADWISYELSDEHVLELTDDSATLGYRATATRPGAEYTALFNSTYVREDGDWRLALHQQTPV